MSFQAVEWARSLPLDSLSEKFTLIMIGSYADTDGTCFPSLSTLAKDTLQSVATVARKIKELEDLGLLVTFERWETPDRLVVVMVEPGQARPPGARRSSNEIRLLLNADVAELKRKVDARAALKKQQRLSITEVEDDGDSPPTQNDEGEPPCTSLSTPPSQAGDEAPPAQACGGLNSDSNHQFKLDSPQTPLAPDASEPAGIEQAEAEEAIRREQEDEQRFEQQLAEFEQAYGYPGSKPGLVRNAVYSLSEAERQKLIRGAIGYATWRRQQTKPPPWIDPRNFARDPALWTKYATFAPAEPKPAREMVALQYGSIGWQAHAVARAIAGLPAPPRRAITIPGQMPAGGEALAVFCDQFGNIDDARWVPVNAKQRECVAWSERAAEWLGERPEARRIRLHGPPQLQLITEGHFVPRYPMVLGLLVPPTPTGFPPPKHPHDAATGPPADQRCEVVMTPDDRAAMAEDWNQK